MESNRSETMTLEEYKEAVRQRLLLLNDPEETVDLMKAYEKHFLNYLQDGWTVNMLATAMETGLN